MFSFLLLLFFVRWGWCPTSPAAHTCMYACMQTHRAPVCSDARNFRLSARWDLSISWLIEGSLLHLVVVLEEKQWAGGPTDQSPLL